MAYTTTSSVSYDTAAYDLLLRFPYRAELYFNRFADVKPTQTTHRGSSVTFFTQSDMAVATTPLTEDVDVTPVALANTSVTVTPAEYGNATVLTAKLMATSMMEVDQAAANVLGYNAGVSIDTIALATWQAGTNVRYAAGDDTASPPVSRVTVDYGAAGSRNTLRAHDLRRAYAELTAANVPTFDGYYVAMLHPDVAFDLKSETGEAGWRAPEVYSNRTGGIATGEIGAFEGFRVIVSPRAPSFVNAGTGSIVDVYRSLFWGREAVAMAHYNGGGYGAEPVSVKGPVTDVLRRFQPLGWKHAVGYGAFRAEALRAVESASSIANNAS
jgi:N4-gp56 family major capsid protein